jgi:hypothetical protein
MLHSLIFGLGTVELIIVSLIVVAPLVALVIILGRKNK